jgi:CelD/BcsL family acetyltransferase involved in cellulose biosynthesis
VIFTYVAQSEARRKLFVTKSNIDELTSDQIDFWKGHFASPGSSVSPFLTYDFARAVNDVRGGVFVLDIRNEEGGRGLIPVQMRKGLASFGHAENVGSSMSDLFGLVGSIGTKLDAAEMLAKAKLNSLRFDHTSPEIWPFDFADRKNATGVCVRIDNSTEYMKRLGDQAKDFMKALDRNKRLISREIGPIEFNWHANDPEQALEWILKAKRSQYQRSGVPDALSAPWRTQLLEKLLAAPQEARCRLVVSTLTANGELISASANIVHERVLHVWFPAYDLQYAKYSPGHMLFIQLFENATQYGTELIDFGKGPADYKLRYRGDTYEVWSGAIRRPTAFGVMDKLLQSAEWRYQKVKTPRA